MTRYISDDVGQFVAIPHAFWEMNWPTRLTASAVLVYLYLKYRAGVSNDAYPSLATIAEESGVSKSTAVRAIKELEEAGLIAVARSRNASSESEVNHYRILNLTQGVVPESYDPSYHCDTTGSVKFIPKQDTLRRDTSEQDTVKNAAGPKSNRRREPDPLYNAIAEAWKGEPYHSRLLTPSQASLVGKVTAEIRAIGGLPEQVPREWAALRGRYDNPTPAALTKHWGTNGTGERMGGQSKPGFRVPEFSDDQRIWLDE